jgi:elongation factor 2
MMGQKADSLDDVPCGSNVGLIGIDQFLVKTGTLTTIDENCHPIRPMAFSVSPVVKLAIKCKNPKDMPKLQEGLRRLVKSDPSVLVTLDEETNENIVAGVGEIHLKFCLKTLREDFCQGAIDFETSDPVVQYKELISASSTK